MGRLQFVSLVAVIATAGCATTRMAQGTVIEFRGLRKRVDRQKVVDVLIISGHTYDYIVKLVRRYGRYPLELEEFQEVL